MDLDFDFGYRWSYYDLVAAYEWAGIVVDDVRPFSKGGPVYAQFEDLTIYILSDIDVQLRRLVQIMSSQGCREEVLLLFNDVNLESQNIPYQRLDKGYYQWGAHLMPNVSNVEKLCELISRRYKIGGGDPYPHIGFFNRYIRSTDLQLGDLFLSLSHLVSTDGLELLCEITGLRQRDFPKRYPIKPVLERDVHSIFIGREVIGGRDNAEEFTSDTDLIVYGSR